MRPDTLSSSTPYILMFSMLSGTRPMKLPTPQDGSSTLPLLRPMLERASYIALITVGEV